MSVSVTMAFKGTVLCAMVRPNENIVQNHLYIALLNVF